MPKPGWMLLAALLLGGCTAPAPPVSPAGSASAGAVPTAAPTATPSGPLKAIKLACLGPQRGELAFLGKPSLQACQMASEGREIQGVKVEIVPADDGGRPEDAAELAKKLVADRSVLGVVGPMTSDSALAAGATLDAARVPFISQSAANPRITASGWKSAHRLVARDDEQGPADAVFLFGPPAYARHVFVADRADAYSQSLADEFQKRGSALGMKIERESGSDLAALVGKAKAANADALFFPDQGSRCSAVLQEMRKEGAEFKLIATDGCHDRERFIAAAQGAAEGMFVSDIAAGNEATPEGQAWAKDFHAKFGAEPGPFSAYAYDAARILLQAIDAAAAGKGGLDIKPTDVNAALGKITPFKGLLGPISFNAKGDVDNAAVYVYQVVGGEFKQVKVTTASSSPVPKPSA